MGKELATVDDRQYDGKAMASLPEQHRQFVIELMDLGVSKEAAKEAAEAVGFHPYSGYRLLRDERVLAAIHEEAAKKLSASALLGVKTLVKIAADDEHKDQFRAAKELAAISGFSPEQKITVEHVTRDSKTMIIEIRSMAEELGIDAAAILKSIGVTDAEFTEVPDGG